jgi:hypothetical protein
MWWHFPKQTKQAKFYVVLTTDNLILYEILYGLLHVLASLAICKLSNRYYYYLLLLLDLRCDFLNFKFQNSRNNLL